MSERLTAERVIELLGLVPHPEEGGHFLETYRSGETIAKDALPDRYVAERSHCTQIYYLLTPTTFSAMHLVKSDEMFHHYLGDSVEQLRVHPDGSSEVVRIGADLEAGERPQVLVPHGVWQGARLAPGGSHGFALMGCTVSPGFEFEDYEMPTPGQLVLDDPEHAELLKVLLVG